jgi:hypothetical protein
MALPMGKTSATVKAIEVAMAATANIDKTLFI